MRTFIARLRQATGTGDQAGSGEATHAPKIFRMWRWVGAIAFAVIVGLMAWPQSELAQPPASALVIDRAELFAAGGARNVSLPNILDSGDFDPAGGRVRYRLSVTLPATPERRLGIYVPRMSLSGALALNGKDIGACENGELEWLRCLHKPQLYTPPLSMWRTGENIIEFEIYASARQQSGLTKVFVGDAEQLATGPHRARFLLQYVLPFSLTVVSLVLGLIALSVGLLLRGEPIFIWFAMTSFAAATANLNVIVQRAYFDPALFSWLIYAARMVSAPFLGMMLLTFFPREKIPKWVPVGVIFYAVAGPLLAALLGNTRIVFAALYAPVFLAAPAVLALMAVWTWRSPRPRHVFATAMFAAVVATGLLDWTRLTGHAAFDGLFLLTYVYSGIMVVTGAVLVNIMASSIITAGEMRATLEHKVAERTAQLKQALHDIEDMERTALKMTENIPIGTYVAERGPGKLRRFVFLSDRFLKLLKLRREEALADPSCAFRSIHPDDYQSFLNSSHGATEALVPFRWTGRLLVNGQVRWVEVESAPRPLREGGALWEGVVSDITEKKAAETALTQANAALVVAESERSRLEEREILLSDMHDGFGSQLASLRFMLAEDKLDRKELNDALNDCAADLYLVIDTLSSTDNTLADAMADFRYRSERRLAEAPAKIHWALTLDDIPKQPQRQILQIMRIVQEALTNALKHAGARNIWIEAGYAPARRSLTISVADDGAGMPQNARRGRGLINMARRARDLDAELAWNARAPGTEARLTMTIR